MSLLHHVHSLLDPSSTPSAVTTAVPTTQSLLPKATGSVASEATSTSSSSTPAGTITSSDFLTLLVTELKNQDPTSDQDPNAYITQLVGVNSLQQLIAINQDLTPSTAS